MVFSDFDTSSITCKTDFFNSDPKNDNFIMMDFNDIVNSMDDIGYIPEYEIDTADLMDSNEFNPFEASPLSEPEVNEYANIESSSKTLNDIQSSYATYSGMEHICSDTSASQDRDDPNVNSAKELEEASQISTPVDHFLNDEDSREKLESYPQEPSTGFDLISADNIDFGFPEIDTLDFESKLNLEVENLVDDINKNYKVEFESFSGSNSSGAYIKEGAEQISSSDELTKAGFFSHPAQNDVDFILPYDIGIVGQDGELDDVYVYEEIEARVAAIVGKDEFVCGDDVEFGCGDDVESVCGDDVESAPDADHVEAARDDDNVETTLDDDNDESIIEEFTIPKIVGGKTKPGNYQMKATGIVNLDLKGGIIKSEKAKVTKPRKNSGIKKSRTKRPKPQFKQDSQFYDRINRYWNTISSAGHYNQVMQTAVPKYTDSSLEVITAEKFLSNVIPALLPNNATIEFFRNKEGIDGWSYYQNPKRVKEKLALRWCGQILNYYDPFIYRRKVNETGKVVAKQGLCPYCPLDENTDLNNIFHNTVDSLYMHHLCKDHGVYSTGYEMDLPLFVCQDGFNKTICTTCGKMCNAIGAGNGLESCLISYFRHVFDDHNKKKQNRSKAEKEMDVINLKFKPKALFESFPSENDGDNEIIEITSKEAQRNINLAAKYNNKYSMHDMHNKHHKHNKHKVHKPVHNKHHHNPNQDFDEIDYQLNKEVEAILKLYENQ